ncbi:MAG: DNA gyrase subunit A, partial [Zetaproteobacteria bacterium]
PHGDAAVYDALVRMAQDWNMRAPLVDGQGNFGSIDGDAPAAMRYTEARMSRLASELLADIDKDTVDFRPNYDGSLNEPEVLPARFPNLLVNGSQGIAVGMATNIPPHNLGEVVDATIALIRNPEVSDEALMKLLPGPDFPTGAFICGRKGLEKAFKTGRGTITMRARTEIETHGKHPAIVVTELPYQVNKAKLVEEIAALVRDKKIDGITDLRDESNREGIRVVIELKRDAVPEVVLNQLYKHTPLQTNFGCNYLALFGGEPRLAGVRELLLHFIDHRKEVVTRRSLFELEKAEARLHIVVGLLRALDHIDAIVALIRQSPTPQDAKTGLMEQFGFSERQAQAILEMRLQRLTGLEREKLEEERAQLEATIARLKKILSDERELLRVIEEELSEIKHRYADPRRTQIVGEAGEIELADLVPEEQVVITLSHRGYIKRIAADAYRTQRRGGKGSTAMRTREEDFVARILVGHSHADLLFFTNQGRVFRRKAFEIPEAGRGGKGRAIVNLLALRPGERVNTMLALEEQTDARFIVMATRSGLVKKTPLEDFRHIRSSGLIAIGLVEGDQLIAAELSDGRKPILLASSNGKAIRFHEEEIRPMGRSARGVRGMRLGGEDRVVAMVVGGEGLDLLAVSERGYGKRTPMREYPMQRRGGQGVFTLKTGARNGAMVGAVAVSAEDEVMLATDTGRLIRLAVREVPVRSRHTAGVKLIEVEEGERVVSLARVCEEDEA